MKRHIRTVCKKLDIDKFQVLPFMAEFSSTKNFTKFDVPDSQLFAGQERHYKSYGYCEICKSEQRYFFLWSATARKEHEKLFH